LYLIGAFIALSSVHAKAGYILTPLWDGPEPSQIIPGSPFNLKFDLTSTTGDTCNSAIFDVVFSTPEIVINSYSWEGCFHDSTYDGSDPSLKHFEAFSLSEPAFGTGALLSMNVTMPTSISTLPSAISVHLEPGVFALGTHESIPLAGSDLTINVVPEPSEMILVIIGFSISAMLVLGLKTMSQRKMKLRNDLRQEISENLVANF
jgi:hypothetical protein